MTDSIRQTLSLPVRGMTCGHCAAHVKKALAEIPGVSEVVVDLNENVANLNYNPSVVDMVDLCNAVTGAGYSVPTQKITLNVTGMSCISCLAHVEGALQNLPGVMETTVSLSQGKAQVQYIPGIVTIPQIEAAVKDAGYSAHHLDQEEQISEGGTAQLSKNHQPVKAAGPFAWVMKSFKKPGVPKN